MNKPLVLIIEDDSCVRNLISTTLETTKNYRFHTAVNGEEGLIEATSQNPDVILLDLGLPDIDGVIVISARGEDKDKIEALDAGADDYLTKPFSVDELLARLRVALRRANYSKMEENAACSVFVNGDLKIDYASGCTYFEGQELRLTPYEYKLLCVLSKNVGKVLTRTYLLKEVWGSSLESDVASLRVYMAMLRKKIEKDPAEPKYIQTHVGIGYRMLRV
jgi:two-component system KDP operon response regulator KdpE